MQKTLLILSVLLSFGLNAQIDRTKTQNYPRGLLGYEQSRILYQGVTYDFWAVANNYEDTELQGKNVQITEDPNDPFKYSVVPDTVGKCTLIVVALIPSIEKSVQMRLDIFSVRPKPDPIVLIGNTWSGNKIKDKFSTLNCRYDPNTGLRGVFEIDSWEITINSKTYSGIGKDLSKEVINAINALDPYEPIAVKLICSEDENHMELDGVFLK